MCDHPNCPGVPWCPPDLLEGDIQFTYDAPTLVKLPSIPNPAFGDPRSHVETVELLQARKAALLAELKAMVRDQRVAQDRIVRLLGDLELRIVSLMETMPKSERVA